MVLRLLENAFVTQKKTKSIHFYSCPQATLPQAFITIFQAEGNYSFPQGRKGGCKGHYGAEK